MEPMTIPLITLCAFKDLVIFLQKISNRIMEAVLNLSAIRLEVFMLVRHSLLNKKDVALADIMNASKVVACFFDKFIYVVSFRNKRIVDISIQMVYH